jgi:hypothetical protein
MPKMSVQSWIEEIDRGLAYRELFGFEHSWRKNELNWTNDPASHAARGANIVFEMGDTLLSSTGALDPEFVVTPEHPAGVERGPVVEALDNTLSRKLKFRKHIYRASLHSYLYNRAILKIGYDSEFGWSPRLDIGSMQQPVGMSLSQFDKSGNRIEFKNITPGMPWVCEVLPHDIVVPWGTVDIDDAPWVAHRVLRETRQIRDDPKYHNTTNLRPNMSMEDFVMSYMSIGAHRTTFEGREYRHVGKTRPVTIHNELWEIHDRRDMRVKVVCRDHKKFLRDEPDAVMMACGMPFVSGSFTEHPRAFWGTPLAYYLSQLQADEYDIALQAEKQRRISVLKYIAAQGFMDEEEVEKLISGDVGAVAFAKVADGLKDKFVTMPVGQLYDFLMQSDGVRRNARSIIGMSRNQAGEFDQSSRRTKGEAMLVAQGAYRRESPRVMMIRDLYIEAMSKVNKLAFSYWTVPRPIMVGREWVRFTGDEIKGDYLYDLTLAAKRDLSRAQRKVEALMMLGQLGPLLQDLDQERIFEYLNAAANDPSFEKLLGLVKGKKQQAGGQQNANI